MKFEYWVAGGGCWSIEVQRATTARWAKSKPKPKTATTTTKAHKGGRATKKQATKR